MFTRTIPESDRYQSELPASHHHYHVQAGHYVVRVRDKTKYLWGSAGIRSNAYFASPMILHIYNTIGSDPITFRDRDV